MAKSKLGEGSKVEKTWESIRDSTKEEPFRIVAQSETGMGSEDVVDELEDDVDQSKASTRLRNTVHQTPISPYHRDGNGNYSLSTVGEYIADEYLEIGESEEDTSPEEENDGQKKLTETDDD
jgi:hypothetical protein